VKGTNYKAPYYEIFSCIRSLSPYSVEILFSACTQSPTVCVLHLMWKNKFHIHIRQQVKLIKFTRNVVCSCLETKRVDIWTFLPATAASTCGPLFSFSTLWCWPHHVDLVNGPFGTIAWAIHDAVVVWRWSFSGGFKAKMSYLLFLCRTLNIKFSFRHLSGWEVWIFRLLTHPLLLWKPKIHCRVQKRQQFGCPKPAQFSSDSLSEFMSILYYSMSRGSSVSIVTDYGLDDRGSIPDRDRGFFF
jgi:hypothetical protein